jgi:hypothetical protein
MKLTAEVVVEVECILNPNYTSLVDLKREAISHACNTLQDILEPYLSTGKAKILGCQKVDLSIDNDLGTA